jgi:hypothetical protein
MYGGLFGDLPAAKNGKASDSDVDHAQEMSIQPTSNELSNSVLPDQASPPANSDKDEKTPTVAPVAELGKPQANATVSIQFIPTSARHKKRPQQAVQSKKRPLAHAALPLSPAAGAQSGRDDAGPPQANTATNELIERQSRTQDLESKETDNKKPPDTSIKSNAETNKQQVLPYGTRVAADIATTKDPSQHQTSKNTTNYDYDTHHSQNIMDPYDPFVPNDYLDYCNQRRQQLELDRIEFERQEDPVRRELARQEATRQRYQERQPGLGRGGWPEPYNHGSLGRGRGISNLPAWMEDLKKRK